MAAINFTLEVPNNVNRINIEEFKRKVTKYAQVVIVSMTKGELESDKDSVIRPLEDLSPEIQNLCGICNIAEDDINGEIARSEALKSI